jgi:hypothetical protein
MDRLIKSLLIVVALCAAAAPALADYYGGQVYYDRFGGYYSGNGGEFTLRSDGGPGLLLSNSAYAAVARGVGGYAESFQTFCVETGEYVAEPMNITVSTTAVAGGPGSHAVYGGTPLGDDLDARTAYLYTKFAQGTLAGYNYTAGVGRVASADALQQAIWYIEGEGGSNNAFVALANDATTGGGSTDEWVGKGIGDVRVLNMYTLGGGLAQDQLYLIPAPAAVVLGLMGFGLVGWVKRRFA